MANAVKNKHMPLINALTFKNIKIAEKKKQYEESKKSNTQDSCDKEVMKLKLEPN